MIAKYDATSIAKYIVFYCERELNKPISNLRLQKILYYVQGVHLAIYKEPIFDNSIEAWSYGPVVPDVYYSYSRFGSNKITGIDEDLIRVEEVDRKIINAVVNKFIDINVWDLVDKTHKENPWMNNYMPGYKMEIPIVDIEDWFGRK